MIELLFDQPHEECGIVGIYLPQSIASLTQAAEFSLFGLIALQHRGQEAAGIAVSDGKEFSYFKGQGLLSQVFDNNNLHKLTGRLALGHTRYSTTGASSTRNIQPYIIETAHGPLALAHNGNITNAEQLRQRLLQKGIGLTSSSDSEILLMQVAGATGQNWVERIANAMTEWQGAYSLVISSRSALYALRDPWGFRPLSVGKLPNGGYVVASETCALDMLGVSEWSEVAPGELVRISQHGITRQSVCPPASTSALCTFEQIYFSRSDSIWDGRSINAVRERFGAQLFKEAPVAADVVLGVPATSIPAAIGYAHASGIPYTSGLIRNNYIGRSFIQPSDELRKIAIKLKFNVLPSSLAGKRVILVDDSIVRGNTSKALVQLIREAGAAEVHLRIACPPIQHPCFMGVDMGAADELISHKLSPAEICQFVGADSLCFLSMAGMMSAIGSTNGYCNACFTGQYPVAIPQNGKDRFEQTGIGGLEDD
ncbi:MAG TPA: amidophosphoribosyltransferase [Anaerolineales bacterium]|nr:amidophosphoribosyltransferase [Anaerolineales bacterium]